MQCMKCGREIPAGEVFCEECLAEMAEYPVKPGAVVTLPNRPKQTTSRKSGGHRSAATLEQQVKKQRKTIRLLCWLLTVTTALLIGVGALTVSLLTDDTDQVQPGQNYSAEGETIDPPGWNIDRTDIYGETTDPTENTWPVYPPVNSFDGN